MTYTTKATIDGASQVLLLMRTSKLKGQEAQFGFQLEKLDWTGLQLQEKGNLPDPKAKIGNKALARE